MTNETPFTVVDGVPREILADGLKRAAAEVLGKAKAELITAIDVLRAAINSPDGNFGHFPEPAHLDAATAKFLEAHDRYLERYAIGVAAYTQGCELLEPEGGQQP